MVHLPSIYDLWAGTFPAVVQSLVVAVGLVLALAFLIHRGLRDDDGVIPSERITLRNLLELLLGGIASLGRDVIGPDWSRYMPVVGTLGFFILVSNLMGLVPGLGGPTSYIEINLGWALIAFFVSEAVGFKEHGLGYFKHFNPGPWWIAILLVPVEIFSHLVRIVSLTIRLTANMFADHTLVGIFLSFPVIQFFVPWAIMGLGCLFIHI